MTVCLLDFFIFQEKEITGQSIQLVLRIFLRAISADDRPDVEPGSAKRKATLQTCAIHLVTMLVTFP